MEFHVHKKTIVVDFDGVIHSYVSPFLEPDFIPDPPVVGAIDFLRRIMENPDYELNIYSTRNNYPHGIRAMQLWLKFWFMKEYGWATGAGLGNQFQKHSSLLSPDHPNYWDYFPLTKPAGWVNIDDRVMCFNGLFPSFDEINNFKAWNDADKMRHKT
jgi:hypothetical protein